MYIGPWQEFALGRAIADRPRRGRCAAPANAPSEAGDADLAQFVSAFKDMAGKLDENGAKNLLEWAPLFMPAIQGMVSGAPAAPQLSQGRRPSLRQSQPRKPGIPAARSSSGKKPLAEARDARLQQLQAMYFGADGAPDASAREPSPPPLPSASRHGEGRGDEGRRGEEGRRGGGGSSPRLPPVEPFGAVAPRGAAPGASLSSSPRGGQGSRSRPSFSPPPRSPLPHAPPAPLPHALPAGDEWEDEVDGLLEWTSSLAVPPSPG